MEISPKANVLTAYTQCIYLCNMNNTTINVRIDSKTKEAASKTFEALGLDISTAVKMFLRRAVDTKSIPFEVRTENGFTLEQENEIIKSTEEALKHGQRYSSIEEAHRDIFGDKSYEQLADRC